VTTGEICSEDGGGILTDSLSDCGVSRTEGHNMTARRLQNLSSQSVKAKLSLNVRAWEGVEL
jgi:hypothetical protein